MVDKQLQEYKNYDKNAFLTDEHIINNCDCLNESQPM